MNLLKNEIDTLNMAIKSYNFPCVCYDFEKDRRVKYDCMQSVEEFINKDLMSGNIQQIKNG